MTNKELQHWLKQVPDDAEIIAKHWVKEIRKDFKINETITTYSPDAANFKFEDNKIIFTFEDEL